MFIYASGNKNDNDCIILIVLFSGVLLKPFRAALVIFFRLRKQRTANSQYYYAQTFAPVLRGTKEESQYDLMQKLGFMAK